MDSEQPYTPTPPSEPTSTPAETSSGLSTQEKNWGMFGHLSALLGFLIPFANIIAPLIIWQMKKETMPFAAGEAKEALNFQITVSIIALVCSVLTLIFIGILGLIALVIANLILTIMSAIKANEGKTAKYPLTLRLVK